MRRPARTTAWSYPSTMGIGSPSVAMTPQSHIGFAAGGARLFAMSFFVMLVLSAGHAEFRTGWFVESLATQTLVVFVIRTRRSPSHTSGPSRAMIAPPIVCAPVGAVLPITPLASALGFTPLPVAFFACGDPA